MSVWKWPLLRMAVGCCIAGRIMLVAVRAEQWEATAVAGKDGCDCVGLRCVGVSLLGAGRLGIARGLGQVLLSWVCCDCQVPAGLARLSLQHPHCDASPVLGGCSVRVDSSGRVQHKAAASSNHCRPCSCEVYGA